MADRLRVLCYHGVEDRPAFERQLDDLQRHLRPVTLAQVHEAMAGGRPLPRRAVLLTFDDGLPSHLRVAGPALADRGLSGVFYVVMGVLGSQTPFWWDAVESRRAALAVEPLVHDGAAFDAPGPLLSRLKTVPDVERRHVLDLLTERFGPPPPAEQLTTEQCRELARAGHALGNHSWSHPLLDRLDDTALHDELGRAHAAYRSAFPDATLTFAYPNGNHDPRVVRFLQEHAYTSAFLFDHGLCGLERPLEVSRLRVNERVRGLRWWSTLTGLDSLRVRARPGAVVPAQRRGAGLP